MESPLWKPIVCAASGALLLAVSGALLTQLGPWYYALKKPNWQPPDWLFGPAWTLIFTLAAISAVLAWRSSTLPSQQFQVIGVFLVNMAFNVLWSLFFFRLHRPDWALMEVGFLWISIVFIMVAVANLSHLAAWLILPYLAWVSFASYLNLTIVRLNQPFH